MIILGASVAARLERLAQHDDPLFLPALGRRYVHPAHVPQDIVGQAGLATEKREKQQLFFCGNSRDLRIMGHAFSYLVVK